MLIKNLRHYFKLKLRIVKSFTVRNNYNVTVACLSINKTSI